VTPGRLRLRRLERACDGALPLITGRPIATVDELFAPLQLPVANHVVEIKPVEHDKSTAIQAFMQEEPFSDRSPVFIGDDTTDLDGFAAMKRFNGLAIAVGSRIPGESRWAAPRDVRAWLESLLVS
jgi:trehalose 6-phosphate phosphatase